jgi:hypothetical protein
MTVGIKAYKKRKILSRVVGSRNRNNNDSEKRRIKKRKHNDEGKTRFML